MLIRIYKPLQTTLILRRVTFLIQLTQASQYCKCSHGTLLRSSQAWDGGTPDLEVKLLHSCHHGQPQPCRSIAVQISGELHDYRLELLPRFGGPLLPACWPSVLWLRSHKFHDEDRSRQLHGFSSRNLDAVIVGLPGAINRLHNRILMLRVVSELEIEWVVILHHQSYSGLW